MHNVLDACISITRGSGRGLGPGILEFLGPVKRYKMIGKFHLGPKKLENFRAQPPPTSPSNGYACIQNIMHKAE